jgi:hypothetical protein
MDALGLFGFLVFIACVISIAATITWLVVKYSPAKRTDQS